MGTMLKQFWNMLAALFAAGEVLGNAATKGAQALDHLGGWCEDTAGAFADKAKEERKQAMAILTATTTQSLITNGLAAPSLPAPSDTTTA